MATLVVPGVRVEARFDVLPPPLAASGILGAVGIVDRPPAEGGTIGATKAAEVRQLLGPGTEATMPQVFHALANGVSEVVIAPVEGGSAASATLLNPNGTAIAALRCRAPGAWGNGLRAEVRQVANAAGEVVRVSLRLLLNGRVRESFEDLQVAPGQRDDLFDAINRRSRLVVATDPGFAGALPEDGTYAFGEAASELEVLEAGGDRPLLRLLPGDEIEPVGLSARIDSSEAGGNVLVEVFRGGLQERFTDLVMDPDSERYLPYVLLTQSRFVRIQPLSSFPPAERLPAATATPLAFTGGASPTVDQYREAIDLLSEDPRIDLVLAAVDPGLNDDQVQQVHQALVAHAVTMADNGAPRIAFGSITPNEQRSLDRIRDHAAAVRNRRFVLVSPAGAEGAVAGAIGRLSTQDSPTFKPVPLHDIAPASYRESELNRLLGPATNLLVVQNRVGRGIVTLRGIDTSGDQISVTRVADQCIRETKAIAENFIGLLNTEEARLALRSQLVATFLRLERAGALVPSTDGSDPAFAVDVYSTQMDFAQGIVRIDVAVRPVRAIDYVYATLRVKN